MPGRKFSEESSKFVLFGKKGTEAEREQLVNYLYDRVVKGKSEERHPLPEAFAYLGESWDKILSTPGARVFLNENKEIRETLTMELLSLASGSRRQYRIQRTPKWSLQLPKFLRELLFFLYKLNNKMMMSLSKMPRIAAWRQQKERAKMSHEIEIKAEQWQQMQGQLSSFTDFAGFWEKGGSQWKNVDFDVLSQFNKELRDNKEIRELAALLGRFSNAEMEADDEQMEQTPTASYRKTFEPGKSDIIGVRQDNDLGHMLPSEAALLGKDNESTTLLFYKKYAEHQLQCLDMNAVTFRKDKDYEEQLFKPQAPRNKGPLLICLDSSASMMGQRERMAKLLAFAVLRMSLKENRKAYLVAFSEGIRYVKLHRLNEDLNALIDFLGSSFEGGSDPNEALTFAMDKMEEKDFNMADILLVTDGYLKDIKPALLLRIREIRKKGNRFFGIITDEERDIMFSSDFTDVWFMPSLKRDVLKKMAEKMKQLTYGS